MSAASYEARSPARAPFDVLAFAVLPALLVGLFTLGVVGHRFAFDFHTFWRASGAVLHGRSPYPDPSAIASARSTSGDFEFFVYPPPFVLALAPLAILPFGVAAALFTALLVGCVLAALTLLGVRDWRCYGAAFLAVPTLSSLRLGEVTPILLLLVAAAWRYRDRWPAVGAAVGGAVVLKLFLWPLVGWLLWTRRWRAAAAASVGGAALTALAWAAIGFRGLADYPTLLRDLARLQGRGSYSLVALSSRLGLPHPNVSWLLPAVLVLAGTCFLCARAGDAGSYSATICLSLLLTPILSLNYLLLLAAPVALSSPVLAPAWALPLVLWLSPFPLPAHHAGWHLGVGLAAVLGALTMHRRAVDIG